MRAKLRLFETLCVAAVTVLAACGGDPVSEEDANLTAGSVGKVAQGVTTELAHAVARASFSGPAGQSVDGGLTIDWRFEDDKYVLSIDGDLQKTSTQMATVSASCTLGDWMLICNLQASIQQWYVPSEDVTVSGQLTMDGDIKAAPPYSASLSVNGDLTLTGSVELATDVHLEMSAGPGVSLKLDGNVGGTSVLVTVNR